MNKYVFSFDAHNLDTDTYDHNDVRKEIINFLLDNEVVSTTINELVDTTIVFKSETDTKDWNDLITNVLLPTMRTMMDDLYYHFVSIKKYTDGSLCEFDNPNRTLKDNFRKLVNEVLAERKK